MSMKGFGVWRGVGARCGRVKTERARGPAALASRGILKG
jgi:hypothetical protein